MLSGRGLGDGLITRPEESYRLWCVLVCDLETSRLRRLKTRKWVVNASRKIIMIFLNVMAVVVTSLGAFAEFRKAIISFVMPVHLSVCPSVLPPGTTQFPLDGFS
jgi:hypothetical protein